MPILRSILSGIAACAITYGVGVMAFVLMGMSNPRWVLSSLAFAFFGSAFVLVLALPVAWSIHGLGLLRLKHYIMTYCGLAFLPAAPFSFGLFRGDGSGLIPMLWIFGYALIWSTSFYFINRTLNPESDAALSS